jgi:hypothetical protein
VVRNIFVLLDIKPCNPLKVSRRFERTSLRATCIHILSLAWLIPLLDRGRRHVPPKRWLSTDYTALYPRRQNPSIQYLFAYLHYIVTCIRSVIIRRGLDGWLDLTLLYTHLITVSNTALSLVYILYSSPLHTHDHYGSQFSLVVSWQRIYNNITVIAAHMKSSLHNLIPFLPSLPNHLRLSSQRDSLNYYFSWAGILVIASGRIQQKTQFPLL